MCTRPTASPWVTPMAAIGRPVVVRWFAAARDHSAMVDLHGATLEVIYEWSFFESLRDPSRFLALVACDAETDTPVGYITVSFTPVPGETLLDTVSSWFQWLATSIDGLFGSDDEGQSPADDSEARPPAPGHGDEGDDLLEPPVPGKPALSTPTVAYIMTLGVRPDRRREGIGRRLIACAMRCCERRWGSQRIGLNCLPTNTAAIRLYEAMGFHKVRTIKDYYWFGGAYHDALVMEAPLRPAAATAPTLQPAEP